MAREAAETRGRNRNAMKHRKANDSSGRAATEAARPKPRAVNVRCSVERLSQFYADGRERVELFLSAGSVRALELTHSRAVPIQLQVGADVYGAAVRRYPSRPNAYYIGPAVYLPRPGGRSVRRTLVDVLECLSWYQPTGTRADDRPVRFVVIGDRWTLQMPQKRPTRKRV